MDDEVLIRNCPPVSARKRFALHKVLKSPEGARAARHQREAEAAVAGAGAGTAGVEGALEREPSGLEARLAS